MALLRRAVCVAIVARLSIWGLMMLAGVLIPPYDSSTQLLFRGPSWTTRAFDPWISKLFAPYASWDGIHFLHVASHGYETEKQFAFFPLFPLVVTCLSDFVTKYIPDAYASVSSIRVVTAVIISNAACVFASVAFYGLSKIVLRSERLANLSFLLMCFSPASVFLCSVYTESLFAFCFIGGLLTLEISTTSELKSEGQSLAAFAWFISLSGFVMAAATRSNGVLTAVFPALVLLSNSVRRGFRWRAAASFVSCAVLTGILIGSPSTWMQIVAARRFCVQSTMESSGSGMPAYCESRLPIVYTEIQKRYWNVGFFRYYELKQVPNFVLAAPAILALTSALWVVRHNLLQMTTQPNFALHRVAYVVYTSLLLLTGVSVLHIQVMTRFVSALPMLYWFEAIQIASGQHTKLILCWHLSFIVLGSALFPAFYPWT